MSKGQKRVTEHTDISATANERPPRIDVKPKQIFLSALSLEKVYSQFETSLSSRPGGLGGPHKLWFSIKSDCSYVADSGILSLSFRTWVDTLGTQADLIREVSDVLVSQNRKTLAVAIVDTRPHQTAQVPMKGASYCEVLQESLKKAGRSISVTVDDVSEKKRIEFSDDIEVFENPLLRYARWMTVIDRRASKKSGKEYSRGSIAGWFPISKSERAHCYWESYDGLFSQVDEWLRPCFSNLEGHAHSEKWVFLVFDWFAQPERSDLKIAAKLLKELVARSTHIGFGERFRNATTPQLALLCTGTLTSDREILPCWAMVSPDQSTPAAQLKLLTQQIYLGIPRTKAVEQLQSHLISMCNQHIGDLDEKTKVCHELSLLRDLLHVRYHLSGDNREITLHCFNHVRVKEGRFEARMARDEKKTRLYARVVFPSLVVVNAGSEELSTLHVPAIPQEVLKAKLSDNILQTAGAASSLLAAINHSPLPESDREELIAAFLQQFDFAKGR